MMQCFRTMWCLPGFACVILLIGCTRSKDTTDAHTIVEAELQAPDVNEQGFAEAEPHESVVFRFRITNVSSKTLSSLRLDANCSCQIAKGPPEALDPGEAALVEVKVRAGAVGRTTEKISLRGAPYNEALVVLNPKLNVQRQVPSFLTDMTHTHLRLVKGHDASAKMVVETVERRGSKPWIQRVAFRADNRIATASISNQFERGDDIESGPRRYAVQFSFLDWPTGSYSGQLEMETADNERKAERCRLSIKPAVSAIPDRITLRGKESSQVAVIDRVGVGVAITEYDADMIEIHEIVESDQLVSFDVKCRSGVTNSAGRSTTILLEDSLGGRYEVSVQFGAERSEG